MRSRILLLGITQHAEFRGDRTNELRFFRSERGIGQLGRRGWIAGGSGLVWEEASEERVADTVAVVNRKNRRFDGARPSRL